MSDTTTVPVVLTDPFDLSQRPPVTEPIKAAIRDAFAIVPEGKNSALVAIWDIGAQEGRLHFAWRITEEGSKFGDWKVGAAIGISKRKRPSGFIGIEAAW